MTKLDFIIKVYDGLNHERIVKQNYFARQSLKLDFVNN